MDYPNLTAEVLTGIVTGIKVDDASYPFTAAFGSGALDVDSPGLWAKWDEVQPIREIVKSFESRHAVATPTDPSGVKTKASGMLLSFKKRNLYPEDLDVLRAVGGTTADRDTALRNVDMILGDIDRRYRREPMEYLIAGALQDAISITHDGVTITPDFGLPGGHDLTASASWATAGTDILADIETMRRLIIQDSGETPTTVWCGRSVPGYLMKNTVIKAWWQNIAGADTRFERMLTATEFSFYGLTWRKMEKGYLSSSTWTPYLGADKIIMTPDPSQRWFQNHRGLVRWPTALMGSVRDFGSSYGVASWARLRDEPPALTMYHRWAGLPVLVFPAAVVNFDTTT